MSLLQADGSVLTSIRRALPVPEIAQCHLLVQPLANVERQALESAIILCAGNLRLCALRLGISRGSLHSKLNGYRVQDGETPLRDRRAGAKTMAAIAGVL